jgi:D-alanyl-D-alanine carboxypeptidase/D-alanyl-D-alanine-endopeptidase (penicillin-binding protein 4)
MAPISAFAVSFNATSVVIQPSVAGQNAFVHLFPSREDVPVTGAITTAEKGKEFSVSTKKNADSGMEILLGGAVKPNGKTKYVYRQVWEPVKNAAECFRAVAKESGIKSDFSIAMGKVDTTKAQLLLSYDSEPISEAVRGMFKHSTNFTAEMMFLTLAAQAENLPATWATGSQVIESWWKERFANSGEISAENGSGMGSKNQCSAEQIADLLDWSAKQSWFYEYISAMSVAGIDGTLTSRFKNTDLKGNLRAKTGTLNDFGVSNLAGYFTVNGELYSVVFIGNDRTTTQYSKWILSENLISMIKRTIEK